MIFFYLYLFLFIFFAAGRADELGAAKGLEEVCGESG